MAVASVMNMPPVPVPEPLPKPTVASRSLDEQYKDRVAAECASGLAGILCREKVRILVCMDHWSDNPPAGQSICKNGGNKDNKLNL